MVTEKKRTRLLLIIIAVLLAAIAFAVLYGLSRPAAELPAVTPRPTAEVIVKEKEVEKLVVMEKEITADIVEDGLNDMGFLITEEYYFTEVVNYSSVKKYWKIELKFTESSFLASYDGMVTAGMDFTKIKVEKDNENAVIRVTLPQAEIKNTDIDPNSFVLYSEKEGLGNRISVAEYNNSLIELENEARRKAEERGVLDRANDNAERVIQQFVGGLLDLSAYTLVFQHAG